MDLSKPLTSRSIHKRKAQDDRVILSKHDKFYATVQRQNFSMPDSVTFYMAKNPKTAELYQKVIQTCKYFFAKNSILVISSLLSYGKNGAYVLFRLDAKVLSISRHDVDYYDLLHLLPSAEKIFMMNVTVKYENGSIVALEEFVSMAVKAKIIRLNSTHLSITSETMKYLLQIPHFGTLCLFLISNIPESFDLDTFYAHMKKNKLTKFRLVFNHPISDAYKTRLEAIFNEIYETEIHDYRPALIKYPRGDDVKYNRLVDKFITKGEILI
uniref:Uncharacterized protein n=1 Tax=Panagrolaimus davidi TaxID=227884 RepID=A0A914P6M7_9BILA